MKLRSGIFIGLAATLIAIWAVWHFIGRGSITDTRQRSLETRNERLSQRPKKPSWASRWPQNTRERWEWAEKHYSSIENLADPRERLRRIRKEMPSEIQIRYFSQVFGELNRRSPELASHYFDEVPPGAILLNIAERNTLEAVTAGLDLSVIGSMIPRLGEKRAEAEAYKALMTSVNWSEESPQRIHDLARQLPSDYLKSRLVYVLAKDLQLKERTDATILDLISRIEDPKTRWTVFIQTGITTESDGFVKGQERPAGLSPVIAGPSVTREQADVWEETGKSMVMDTDPGKGFDALKASFVGLPPEESEVRLRGWFVGVADADLSAMPDLIVDHPELRKDDYMRPVVDHYLRTDRAQLKDWISTNLSESDIAGYSLRRWADYDSLEATAWVESIKDPSNKRELAKILVPWIKENGTASEVEAWERIAGDPN